MVTDVISVPDESKSLYVRTQSVGYINSFAYGIVLNTDTEVGKEDRACT